MPEPRNPRAGGAIVALTTLAGAFVGAIARQPSIGILAGFALGVVIAVLIWRADHRRR